ncbi:hypothetical protein QYE76_036668 [Lolium multiflorum]|uniref:Uncharacterized protein n=1 Tax=Lolium multiflorum TaxID=4521 RepID=A0AAD8VQ68_LOLMU|nr:hypothetical protein QYE76_036668 [Lolium multiflorum]
MMGIEEGKDEFQRTDAVLSAHYALAKGTNRADCSQKTTAGPILWAVAALIVAFVAAVGAAPGGFVVAPMAANWALVVSLLLSLLPFLSGRGEVAGEVVIVALLHRFPNGEEAEVTLPVGQGFVILGPYEGVMVLLSHFVGARISYAACVPHEGVSSRIGEDTWERSDEEEEEEDEDMVAEEGFLEASAKGMRETTVCCG